MSDQKIEIWYDDQPDSVVLKINNVLLAHGLAFVDDGTSRDGLVVYELRTISDNAGVAPQQ